MKTKYIVIFVSNGITNQVEYDKTQKSEAIAAYKNIRMRADRAKLVSIDSEDEDIWYDLSNKF